MRKLFVLFAVLSAGPAIAQQTENYMSYSVTISALVADSEAAADDVALWIENTGNYFLYKGMDQLTVRCPVERIEELRRHIDVVSEELYGYTVNAQDTRQLILQLESGIRAREEILGRNLDFLDKADVNGTLAIEKEVTLLLTELDSLKGRLNLANVNRRFAFVQVNLSFLTPTIHEDTYSSFPWLNTLDFFQFMEEGY